MQQSNEIQELTTALSKAQVEFKAAKKSGKNPVTHSEYSKFEDVIDAIKQPLADHGLAFVQVLDSDAGGNPMLTTRLYHASGQWMGASILIDAMAGNRGTNAMQAFGATLTYMKRYALSAMLGIASDEDDDGNSAGSGKKHKQSKREASRPSPSGEIKPGTCSAMMTPNGNQLGKLTVDELQTLIDWGQKKRDDGETLQQETIELLNCANAVRDQLTGVIDDPIESDANFIATEWGMFETKSGKPYIGFMQEGHKWPDAKWWKGRTEFLAAVPWIGVDHDDIEKGARFECNMRVFCEVDGQYKNAFAFEDLS